MQIAPDIYSSQWQALELDDPNSLDWEKAISILRSRIYGRYFDPADQLILAEQSKPAYERRFGFTIVAIDCLLIETFGAFLQGLETTDGISKKTFREFLTSRQRFNGDFTDDLANQFYIEFRCGILHQGEIGGGSKVWSVGNLIRDTYGNLTINRNELHDRLKAEFEDYLNELSNPANVILRQNFRKKMDFICRH